MCICTNTYILIATVVLDGKNWQEIIEYDIHPNKKIEEILRYVPTTNNNFKKEIIKNVSIRCNMTLS